MAVSVCSLCRLNLLVPTPAWRLRLVLPPIPLLSDKDSLKERAGLVSPTVFMVFTPAGVPGEGAGVAATAVAPGMTGWARRDPDSWQETVGAGGEEGPGTKLDNSRVDLYVLEEKTQSSGQSEHPLVVFSFLFVHSASQHSPNPCCWCVPLKHLCCWFFL